MSKRKYWSFKLDITDDRFIYIHVNRSSKGNYRYTFSDKIDSVQTEIYVGKQSLSFDSLKKIIGLPVKQDVIPEYLEFTKEIDPVPPNGDLNEMEYKL